jgi:hypothetical protein
MGAFDAISQFSHKSDLRESKDEMLVGELVRAMARQGHETDQFAATGEFQRVRFRIADDVLTHVHLVLDRKSRGALIVAGEVKNNLSDPGELIDAWRTQPQSTDNVEIICELNSVIGRTTDSIEVDDFVMKGAAATDPLVGLLSDRINRVREALRPYKRETA